MKTIIVTDDAKASTNGHKNTRKLQKNLPKFVVGIISQNQTVVIVTSHHHNEIGIEVNLVFITSFSKKYTKYDQTNNTTTKIINTALYSST